MRTPIRLLLAGLLGVAAAALVACGSSGKGLIPLANAGPLQSDFETVAQDAQNGDGDCAATTSSIAKTEQDFSALPATIDRGLRERLGQGITNLRKRALELCKQPLAQTTTTSTAPRTTTTKTQPTETTPIVTQTTSTQTTSTQTTTPSSPGGGTAAPGTGESSPGGGVGPGGGTGVGEAETGNPGNGNGRDNGRGNGNGNGSGADVEPQEGVK